MSIQKHVHKLQKYKYKTGNSVFFCTLNCSYKIEVALSIGKLTLCHICNNQFIMTEAHIKLKRPHCINCGKVKVIDSQTGKSHYITKQNSKISSSVVTEELDDLRDRLNNLTGNEDL